MVRCEDVGGLRLFPGRIDLGIGRGPGTDPETACLLRRGSPPGDFSHQLTELLGYFSVHVPETRAVPSPESAPEIHVLGSSPASATRAAILGLPFTYAHHLNRDNTLTSIEAYRAAFRPSAYLHEPHVIVSASVIAADSDERARWLAGPMALSMLRLRNGFGQPPFASPQEAVDHPYTAEERELVRDYIDSRIFGGPDTVRRRLTELLQLTAADELMVITITHDHRDRIRSYELIAQQTSTDAGQNLTFS